MTCSPWHHLLGLTPIDPSIHHRSYYDMHKCNVCFSQTSIHTGITKLKEQATRQRGTKVANHR
jgi:hypothetical protein